MSAQDQIETVRLELIRPGPTHGQLLSPLTPYLALCGDESPVTLQIEFEHWRLLNRLDRLRYGSAESRQRAVARPDSSRESELEELGRDIGQIVAAIPTLGRELGRAAGEGSGLVHLRLVISGSELSLLPWEILISPIGYPGLGRSLLLQSETPIVMTREIRRGQHKAEVRWNRKPNILFASAAPEGLDVPAKEHVLALREVLEPWVSWVDDPQERLTEVSENLTVLKDASLRMIRDACSKRRFTHVHILAHGGSYKESGQRRYGLVLCSHRDSKEAHVVDGQSLAEALHVKLESARGDSSPIVVSLATCDAANTGSVVAPGASIAHDLHAHGVPWIFASQLPLTKRGSLTFTEELYERLLWGEDPRLLLKDLRLTLHTLRRNDHDWGSLVAYATIPESLAEDVAMFRSRQFQRAIDTDCERARHYAEREEVGAFRKALDAARARIGTWEVRLPPFLGKDTGTLSRDVVKQRRGLYAEYFGVKGATEKKIAELLHHAGLSEEEHSALQTSRQAYTEALRIKPDSHWVATQYLAISAILQLDPEPDRWESTRDIAKGQVEVEVSRGVDRAWALGTLAELELLRFYHAPSRSSPGDVGSRVVGLCEQIVQEVGRDDFSVFSTRRQFQRYVDWWKNDVWTETAKAAVAVLTRGSSLTQSSSSRQGRR